MPLHPLVLVWELEQKQFAPSVVANSKATKPTARTSLGVFPCIQDGAYRDVQSWDHHLFLMIYRNCRKSVLITCTITYNVCVHILSWSFHERMVHVASGKQSFPSRPIKLRQDTDKSIGLCSHLALHAICSPWHRHTHFGPIHGYPVAVPHETGATGKQQFTLPPPTSFNI